MVAQNYNTIYLGGRGRKIKNLRAARTKLLRSYLKNKGNGSITHVQIAFLSE
jgi:hypothetical protein